MNLSQLQDYVWDGVDAMEAAPTTDAMKQLAYRYHVELERQLRGFDEVVEPKFATDQTVKRMVVLSRYALAKTRPAFL